MDESQKIIECVFLTEADLYRAYMPFLSGGGLFVRMNPTLPLGEQTTLSIQMMDEPERYTISTEVVWCTPNGAQGNKFSGIGFKFIDDNARHFCNKIETCLAGMLKSTQPTDTM